MKVYNYNENTKEFIGETTAAENPLEKGKYLIPSNATTTPIIAEKSGYARVYNEAEKVWEYVEDNRGTIVYDTTTKQESKVDYLGPIKNGFTKIKPTEFDVWDSNANSWVVDINLAQTAKIQEIKSAYEKANQEDIAYMNTAFQADNYSQDLIAKVLATGSVPDSFFWLDKDNNQVSMTYQDLQGLSQAILIRNQQNFVKYQTLKNQIKQTTTQDELNLISW